MVEARGGLVDLTAAVPDGFLMCPTHDPELVCRLADSSPTLISWPTETDAKTQIKQKHKHNMLEIVVEMVAESLFCNCVFVCIVFTGSFLQKYPPPGGKLTLCADVDS